MPAMHPLGELIAARMRVNGWSLDAVVARINAAGHQMKRSNLSRIRNEPVVSLKGDVIRAIADGIGVTERQVANAALESMGIPAAAAEVIDSLVTIDLDPTLSDANRRQLKMLIEQMRLDSPKAPTYRFRRGERSSRENRADEAH